MGNNEAKQKEEDSPTFFVVQKKKDPESIKISNILETPRMIIETKKIAEPSNAISLKKFKEINLNKLKEDIVYYCSSPEVLSKFSQCFYEESNHEFYDDLDAQIFCDSQKEKQKILMEDKTQSRLKPSSQLFQKIPKIKTIKFLSVSDYRNPQENKESNTNTQLKNSSVILSKIDEIALLFFKEKNELNLLSGLIEIKETIKENQINMNSVGYCLYSAIENNLSFLLYLIRNLFDKNEKILTKFGIVFIEILEFFKSTKILFFIFDLLSSYQELADALTLGSDNQIKFKYYNCFDLDSLEISEEGVIFNMKYFMSTKVNIDEEMFEYVWDFSNFYFVNTKEHLFIFFYSPYKKQIGGKMKKKKDKTKKIKSKKKNKHKKIKCHFGAPNHYRNFLNPFLKSKNSEEVNNKNDDEVEEEEENNDKDEDEDNTYSSNEKDSFKKEKNNNSYKNENKKSNKVNDEEGNEEKEEEEVEEECEEDEDNKIKIKTKEENDEILKYIEKEDKKEEDKKIEDKTEEDKKEEDKKIEDKKEEVKKIEDKKEENQEKIELIDEKNVFYFKFGLNDKNLEDFGQIDLIDNQNEKNMTEIIDINISIKGEFIYFFYLSKTNTDNYLDAKIFNQNEMSLIKDKKIKLKENFVPLKMFNDYKYIYIFSKSNNILVIKKKLDFNFQKYFTCSIILNEDKTSNVDISSFKMYNNLSIGNLFMLENTIDHKKYISEFSLNNPNSYILNINEIIKKEKVKEKEITKDEENKEFKPPKDNFKLEDMNMINNENDNDKNDKKKKKKEDKDDKFVENFTPVKISYNENIFVVLKIKTDGSQLLFKTTEDNTNTLINKGLNILPFNSNIYYNNSHVSNNIYEYLLKGYSSYVNYFGNFDIISNNDVIYLLDQPFSLCLNFDNNSLLFIINQIMKNDKNNDIQLYYYIILKQIICCLYNNDDFKNEKIEEFYKYLDKYILVNVNQKSNKVESKIFNKILKEIVIITSYTSEKSIIDIDKIRFALDEKYTNINYHTKLLLIRLLLSQNVSYSKIELYQVIIDFEKKYLENIFNNENLSNYSLYKKVMVYASDLFYKILYLKVDMKKKLNEELLQFIPMLSDTIEYICQLYKNVLDKKKKKQTTSPSSTSFLSNLSIIYNSFTFRCFYLILLKLIDGQSFINNEHIISSIYKVLLFLDKLDINKKFNQNYDMNNLIEVKVSSLRTFNEKIAIPIKCKELKNIIFKTSLVMNIDLHKIFKIEVVKTNGKVYSIFLNQINNFVFHDIKEINIWYNNNKIESTKDFVINIIPLINEKKYLLDKNNEDYKMFSLIQNTILYYFLYFFEKLEKKITDFNANKVIQDYYKLYQTEILQFISVNNINLLRNDSYNTLINTDNNNNKNSQIINLSNKLMNEIKEIVGLSQNEIDEQDNKYKSVLQILTNKFINLFDDINIKNGINSFSFGKQYKTKDVSNIVYIDIDFSDEKYTHMFQIFDDELTKTNRQMKFIRSTEGVKQIIQKMFQIVIKYYNYNNKLNSFVKLIDDKNKDLQCSQNYKLFYSIYEGCSQMKLIYNEEKNRFNDSTFDEDANRYINDNLTKLKFLYKIIIPSSESSVKFDKSIIDDIIQYIKGKNLDIHEIKKYSDIQNISCQLKTIKLLILNNLLLCLNDENNIKFILTYINQNLRKPSQLGDNKSKSFFDGSYGSDYFTVEQLKNQFHLLIYIMSDKININKNSLSIPTKLSLLESLLWKIKGRDFPILSKLLAVFSDIKTISNADKTKIEEKDLFTLEHNNTYNIKYYNENTLNIYKFEIFKQLLHMILAKIKEMLSNDKTNKEKNNENNGNKLSLKRVVSKIKDEDYKEILNIIIGYFMQIKEDNIYYHDFSLFMYKNIINSHILLDVILTEHYDVVGRIIKIALDDMDNSDDKDNKRYFTKFIMIKLLCQILNYVDDNNKSDSLSKCLSIYDKSYMENENNSNPFIFLYNKIFKLLKSEKNNDNLFKKYYKLLLLICLNKIIEVKDEDFEEEEENNNKKIIEKLIDNNLETIILLLINNTYFLSESKFDFLNENNLNFSDIAVFNSEECKSSKNGTVICFIKYSNGQSFSEYIKENSIIYFDKLEFKYSTKQIENDDEIFVIMDEELNSPLSKITNIDIKKISSIILLNNDMHYQQNEIMNIFINKNAKFITQFLVDVLSKNSLNEKGIYYIFRIISKIINCINKEDALVIFKYIVQFYIDNKNKEDKTIFLSFEYIENELKKLFYINYLSQLDIYKPKDQNNDENSSQISSLFNYTIKNNTIGINLKCNKNIKWFENAFIDSYTIDKNTEYNLTDLSFYESRKYYKNIFNDNSILFTYSLNDLSKLTQVINDNQNKIKVIIVENVSSELVKEKINEFVETNKIPIFVSQNTIYDEFLNFFVEGKGDYNILENYNENKDENSEKESSYIGIYKFNYDIKNEKKGTKKEKDKLLLFKHFKSKEMTYKPSNKLFKNKSIISKSINTINNTNKSSSMKNIPKIKKNFDESLEEKDISADSDSCCYPIFLFGDDSLCDKNLNNENNENNEQKIQIYEEQRKEKYNQITNDTKKIFDLYNLKLSKRLIFDIMCLYIKDFNEESIIKDNKENLKYIFESLCMEYYSNVNGPFSVKLFKNKLKYFLKTLSSQHDIHTNWFDLYINNNNLNLKKKYISLNDYLSNYSIDKNNNEEKLFDIHINKFDSVLYDKLLFLFKEKINEDIDEKFINNYINTLIDILTKKINDKTKLEAKKKDDEKNDSSNENDSNNKVDPIESEDMNSGSGSDDISPFHRIRTLRRKKKQKKKNSSPSSNDINNFECYYFSEIMNTFYDCIINNKKNSEMIKGCILSSKLNENMKNFIVEYLNGRLQIYLNNKTDVMPLSDTTYTQCAFKYLDLCLFLFFKKKENELFEYWFTSKLDCFKFYCNYKTLSIEKYYEENDYKEILSLIAYLTDSISCFKNNTKEEEIKEKEVSDEENIFKMKMNHFNKYSVKIKGSFGIELMPANNSDKNENENYNKIAIFSYDENIRKSVLQDIIDTSASSDFKKKLIPYHYISSEKDIYLVPLKNIETVYYAFGNNYSHSLGVGGKIGKFYDVPTKCAGTPKYSWNFSYGYNFCLILSEEDNKIYACGCGNGAGFNSISRAEFTDKNRINEFDKEKYGSNNTINNFANGVCNTTFVTNQNDEIFAIGVNENNTLGFDEDNTKIKYLTKIEILQDNIKVVSMSISQFNGYVIDSNGKCYGIGDNSCHQINSSSEQKINKWVNIPLPSRGKRFLQCMTGDKNLLCLVEDLKGKGKVYSQGSNEDCLCGIIDTENDVTSLTLCDKIQDLNFKYIYTRNNQCAAITENGELYTWGQNNLSNIGRDNDDSDSKGPGIVTLNSKEFPAIVDNAALCITHMLAVARVYEKGSYRRKLFACGDNLKGCLGKHIVELSKQDLDKNLTEVKLVNSDNPDSVLAPFKVSVGFNRSFVLCVDENKLLENINNNQKEDDEECSIKIVKCEKENSIKKLLEFYESPNSDKFINLFRNISPKTIISCIEVIDEMKANYVGSNLKTNDITYQEFLDFLKDKINSNHELMMIFGGDENDINKKLENESVFNYIRTRICIIENNILKYCSTNEISEYKPFLQKIIGNNISYLSSEIRVKRFNELISRMERNNGDLNEVRIDRFKANKFYEKFNSSNKKIPDIEFDETIFGQAFHNFIGVSGDKYLLEPGKRLFVVVLANEFAQDSGGPYHEVMSCICDELQSDYLDLFIKTPNNKANIGQLRDKYIPNPQACREIHENVYEFLGKLMASSMASGEALDLNFHPIVWKSILGNEITFYDYESVDVNFFNFINQLEMALKNKEENFKNTYNLNFVIKNSNEEDIELLPDGNNILVDFDNLKEYIDLSKKKRINEFATQMEFIKKGFYSVISNNYLQVLHWRQVEEMVCGKNKMDVHEFRQNTGYEGFNENDNVVLWFWEWLENASEKEKCMYLKFVSGRTRLPKSGMRFHYRHVISRNYDDPKNSFPSSATCFFKLKLPNYDSKEIFVEKMKYSIMNCMEIDADQ